MDGQTGHRTGTGEHGQGGIWTGRTRTGVHGRTLTGGHGNVHGHESLL